MGFCLIGGPKVVVIAADLFAVAWSQTGSPTEWQRSYDVAPGAIVTRELRARHFPAGEAPLPGGEVVEGWTVWHGARRVLPAVSFGSEPGAENWRLCTGGECRPLSEVAGAPEGSDITAVPCKGAP